MDRNISYENISLRNVISYLKTNTSELKTIKIIYILSKIIIITYCTKIKIILNHKRLICLEIWKLR